MTKEQIDELMRENGVVVVGEAVYVLCNLVEEQSAAAEREACAEICDSFADDPVYCGELIRARGQG
jgi:hypothetical protein